MKASGQQFDDVVVEVSWDPKGGPIPADGGEPTPAWRLHRVRDDKHDGNHHTIVQKIITSIEDGVEEDEVSTGSGSGEAAPADRFLSSWSAPSRRCAGRGSQKNGRASGRPASCQARRSSRQGGGWGRARRCAACRHPDSSGSAMHIYQAPHAYTAAIGDGVGLVLKLE